MSVIAQAEGVHALTSIQRMHYNVGIMNNTTRQITIRGIDPATKNALMKKAKQHGTSLNQYALKALRQSAGVDDSEVRYRAMKQFLKKHHMSRADKKAFDDAIVWLDKTSMDKQRREERESGI
jgi:hypothetical protein